MLRSRDKLAGIWGKGLSTTGAQASGHSEDSAEDTVDDETNDDGDSDHDEGGDERGDGFDGFIQFAFVNVRDVVEGFGEAAGLLTDGEHIKKQLWKEVLPSEGGGEGGPIADGKANLVHFCGDKQVA